jgi:hypothetical protein
MGIIVKLVNKVTYINPGARYEVKEQDLVYPSPDKL